MWASGAELSLDNVAEKLGTLRVPVISGPPERPGQVTGSAIRQSRGADMVEEILGVRLPPLWVRTR